MRKSAAPLRAAARSIYSEALKAVNGQMAVRRFVRLNRGILYVAGRRYALDRYRRILVLGAGKASAAMAKGLESILGRRISDGLVVVKYGHSEKLKRIRVIEAGHPEPDHNGLRGAQEICRLAEAATSQDLVFCLLSGGGSALLPLPAEGITLEEKIQLNSLLLKCGATIHEINTVRKHVSRLKGGQLAKLLAQTHVITLALSDVVGDDLSSIASGPTVPDHTTFADALAVLKKYEVLDCVPKSIVSYLERGAQGEMAETPKAGDPCFKRKLCVIVGSNILACKAAAAQAKRLGFRALILSSSVEGDTAEAARLHVAIAREVARSGNPVMPPACLISGGETTVKVTGSGIGGRNQHFALCCVEPASKFKREVVFLSLGTDGTDGPTEAAGAIVDNRTLARAQAVGLDPRIYLQNNDSYNFFKPLNDLIVTGPTRTNVMDLRLVLIK